MERHARGGGTSLINKELHRPGGRPGKRRSSHPKQRKGSTQSGGGSQRRSDSQYDYDYEYDGHGARSLARDRDETSDAIRSGIVIQKRQEWTGANHNEEGEQRLSSSRRLKKLQV